MLRGTQRFSDKQGGVRARVSVRIRCRPSHWLTTPLGARQSEPAREPIEAYSPM